MHVVFLHGIGDGNRDYDWLDGLNRGLTQAGFDPVDRADVLAPRYADLLKTDGITAKLPAITYKVKDDALARREFERRQARVQRLLRQEFGVRTYGFNLIPDPVWNAAPGAVVDYLSMYDLDQVRRYIGSDGLRAAIMLRIINALPDDGEVVLIGHSLGSVIAIDLLDHLPEQLHVRRFITIGSPAGIRALHEGSERLLKRFPYSRVDDWSNFLNVRDIVTGGRGLASTFPGAQDFMLTVRGHQADTYLGDPAVAGLVADALYPQAEPAAATGTDIAVRMSEAEASALLVQHFGEAVARHIRDSERADRYRATLQILRDDLAAQLAQQAAGGQLLAPELQELAAGRLPALPHRWELHEAIGELVVLALTNCVTPYEIDTGDAPIKALEDIAEALGFRRDVGKTVATAIKDVQAAVSGKSGVPWGRVLTAAAGVALIAAGPVGLAVAAPAGAFGAAAVAGGLAAFGPGGMVGGLAMVSGLAGTGAATTAAALASGHGSAETAPNLDKLMMRVAAEHARKLLDLGYDSRLWYQVTDFESQVSAVINRLEPFNDPKSARVMQLTAAKVAINALLQFMSGSRLAPNAITDGGEP
jgi:pimeloyl-ACP methyl ester carboxylesterase